MSRLFRRNRIVGIIAGLAILVIACNGVGDLPPTRDPALPPHIPDAANGERLFVSESCSACHSTGSRRITGPGLAGIGASAATRDAALTTDQYIEQAIRNPGAFVVGGFNNLMPRAYANLPQDDVDDLIAYLKTLQ
ncbi:MAG: c-type cytochrome [Chloroflexi bacterium]|nr:c-type cytochrome [Chloroflexota bacterium]